jgi:peptidylprolyl isomerase
MDRKQQAAIVIIVVLMAAVAVLLVLLMNADGDSDDTGDPLATQVTDAESQRVEAFGTPVGDVGYVPEGCWSGEPSTEEGYPQWDQAPEMVIDEDATYTAAITTNKGEMTFELDAEAAPMAVNNFVCLAASGFYDIVPFHRVISGFMVQSGDPTGTGTGGPGYRFEEELPGDDLNYERGTLAMARTQQPGSQGSQFFIVHQDLNDQQLPKNYTIFGHLVEGADVLDDLADAAVIPGSSGEPSYPAEFLVIEDITIHEEPAS